MHAHTRMWSHTRANTPTLAHGALSVHPHLRTHTDTHMFTHCHTANAWMNVCINAHANPALHAYMHTHMYMHTRVCRPTRMQACTWSSVSVRTHGDAHVTPVHTLLQIQTYAWMNMCTCTCKPASACIHVLTCMYVLARTHAVTHACKCTHTCTWSSASVHNANVHGCVHKCACEPTSACTPVCTGMYVHACTRMQPAHGHTRSPHAWGPEPRPLPALPSPLPS